MLAGVLPIIARASEPTETISSVFVFFATTDGSRNTMPFPSEKTIVFAVPRSIPIFLAPNPNTLSHPFVRLI